jgi:hypothetical protein
MGSATDGPILSTPLSWQGAIFRLSPGFLVSPLWRGLSFRAGHARARLQPALGADGAGATVYSYLTALPATGWMYHHKAFHTNALCWNNKTVSIHAQHIWANHQRQVCKESRENLRRGLWRSEGPVYYLSVYYTNPTQRLPRCSRLPTPNSHAHHHQPNRVRRKGGAGHRPDSPRRFRWPAPDQILVSGASQ